MTTKLQLSHEKSGDSAYVERIRKHTQFNNRRQLYTDYDYLPLLWFLTSPQSGSSAPSGDSRSPSRDRADTFAWAYHFKPDFLSTPTKLTSPAKVKSLDGAWQTYTSCGHLLLLRGYPSPQWLDTLGSVYHIDAEFWRQHLDFLGSSLDDVPSSPSLPSSACDVLKLRITTIGMRNRFATAIEQSHVAELRREASQAMEKYNTDLRMGKGWRTGDSIVRGYTVYDSETFSIDQTITVCLNKSDIGRTYWQALIYTDCGEDLRASPHGPWLGESRTRTVDDQTNLLPLNWHTEKIMSKTDTEQGAYPEDRNNGPEHGFRQNMQQLHIDLGRNLDHTTMCADPFYAVGDVFKLVSLAESKFLNMIMSKLGKDSKNIMIDTDPNGQTPEENIFAQSNLIRNRQILEDHILNLREALSFIRRQRDLGIWPALETKSDHKIIAHRSLLSLEHDFLHLLETAEGLHKRCESAMVIAMNSASIAEARRGLVQAKSLFKFTVLASFYVPLSFTGTLMGMNVKENTSGSIYGIWVFFAVTLPIFGVSALFLFVDWGQLYKNLIRMVRSFQAG